MAEICVRLDGMPLALELAAARVGALSPAQIAERLGDALAVLTAGSRSALDRQQTLRATLDWSHDLLDRRRSSALFRRLAVFAGAFALERGRGGDRGDDLGRAEVADLLGRLVDKSLVRRRTTPATATATACSSRCASTRASASARRARRRALEAAPLRLLPRAGARADPDARPGVDRARRSRSRPSTTTCAPRSPGRSRARPGGRARRSPSSMWPMWMAGGHFREGSRWLDAALAAAPEPTALRAEALRGRGRARDPARPTRRPRALGASGWRSSATLGDRRAIAHALDEAGVYDYMAGRDGPRDRLYAESRALAEELGRPPGRGRGPALAGRAAPCARGDFARAREALLDSLGRLRELPTAAASRSSACHRRPVRRAGRPARRAAHVLRGDAAVLPAGGRRARRSATCWRRSATCARADGLTAPRARARSSESLAHFRELGDPMGTALRAEPPRLPRAATAATYDLGREWLEEALALRRELGDRRGVGMTLGNLGVLAAAPATSSGQGARSREALALLRGDRRRARAGGHAARPRPTSLADAGEPDAPASCSRTAARAGRGRACPRVRGLGRRSRWPSWRSRAGDGGARRRLLDAALAACDARRPLGRRAPLRARSSGR